MSLEAIQGRAKREEPGPNDGSGLGQTVAGAVGQQIGNTSIQLTQRELQVPPTLAVPPGYLFDVLIDRDIVLAAPYASGGAP